MTEQATYTNMHIFRKGKKKNQLLKPQLDFPVSEEICQQGKY